MLYIEYLSLDLSLGLYTRIILGWEGNTEDKRTLLVNIHFQDMSEVNMTTNEIIIMAPFRTCYAVSS